MQDILCKRDKLCIQDFYKHDNPCMCKQDNKLSILHKYNVSMQDISGEQDTANQSVSASCVQDNNLCIKHILWEQNSILQPQDDILSVKR